MLSYRHVLYFGAGQKRHGGEQNVFKDVSLGKKAAVRAEDLSGGDGKHTGILRLVRGKII